MNYSIDSVTRDSIVNYLKGVSFTPEIGSNIMAIIKALNGLPEIKDIVEGKPEIKKK